MVARGAIRPARVTFVDVPARTGPESEARGIAEAIPGARAHERLRTPIVAIITGEGGSGGAIAVAAANKV